MAAKYKITQEIDYEISAIDVHEAEELAREYTQVCLGVPVGEMNGIEFKGQKTVRIEHL